MLSGIWAMYSFIDLLASVYYIARESIVEEIYSTTIPFLSVLQDFVGLDYFLSGILIAGYIRDEMFELTCFSVWPLQNCCSTFKTVLSKWVSIFAMSFSAFVVTC